MPNVPTTAGFTSGTYYDGTTFYVGQGNFDVCYGENPGPARIMITSSLQGNGAYYPCNTAGGEYFSNSSEVKYILDHPDLHWILTNGSQYGNVANAIKIGTSYIGRIDVNLANGTYQQIGKVKDGKIYYSNIIPGAEAQWTGTFEVLACSPCPLGGSGPYCCTNGANSE